MPTNPMQPVIQALQPTIKPTSTSAPVPTPEPAQAAVDPGTVPAHSHQEREFARKLIAAGAPASEDLKKEAQAIGYDEDYDSSNESFLDRVFHTSH